MAHRITESWRADVRVPLERSKARSVLGDKLAQVQNYRRRCTGARVDIQEQQIQACQWLDPLKHCRPSGAAWSLARILCAGQWNTVSPRHVQASSAHSNEACSDMSSSTWYTRVWSTAGGSLDRLYAGVIHSIGSAKFFRDGWGDLSLLSASKFYRALVSLQYGPNTIQISWKPVQTGVHRGKPFQMFEGSFESPASSGVSNLPLCCLDGRVWLMRPGEATYGPTGMSACVIQLAATGEHGPEYDHRPI